MNKKEIESTLAKHLYKLGNDYGISQEYVENYLIVCGGCIVSLLNGEEPNDIDIWVSDYYKCMEVCSSINSSIFAQKYNISSISNSTKIPWLFEGRELHSNPGEVIIDLPTQPHESCQNTKSITGLPSIEVNDYTKKYLIENYKYYGNSSIGSKRKGNWISSNAINLDDGKYQIITRTCGSPMQIQTNFDFVHCISYFSFKTGLVLNKFALESILTKELFYMGGKWPLSSLVRMNKFISRGWKISEKEILKICWDISRLDLSVKQTIVDQARNFGMNKLFSDVNDSYIDRDKLFEILDK